MPMNPSWRKKGTKEEKFPKGSPSSGCIFVSQESFGVRFIQYTLNWADRDTFFRDNRV